MQTKRSKRDGLATESDRHAYRGHMVRRATDGQWFVERDGFLICWASSPDKAHAEIDGLLD